MQVVYVLNDNALNLDKNFKKLMPLTTIQKLFYIKTHSLMQGLICSLEYIESFHVPMIILFSKGKNKEYVLLYSMGTGMVC